MLVGVPRALIAVLLAAVAATLGACGGRDGSAAHAGRAPGAGNDARRPAASSGAPASGDPFPYAAALADIARRNGGARAAGTPGGVATEDFVAGRLRAAGWTVRLQRVTFPFFDERRAPRVTLPGGRRLAPGADVR